MPGRISSMNRSTMLPLTGGSAEGNGIPSGDGGSGSGLGRFPRSMARTAQTTADNAAPLQWPGLVGQGPDYLWPVAV